jgi:hypothetical protein
VPRFSSQNVARSVKGIWQLFGMFIHNNNNNNNNNNIIIIIIIIISGVRLSPLGTSATIWSTVPATDDR